MEYNPENAFEKNKCNSNKCDGNRGVCEISGCYETCFNEYLKQQNKQMLEALIKIYNNRGEEDKLYIYADRLKPLINSITQKKISEVIE
jgi:hypothetical protein